MRERGSETKGGRWRPQQKIVKWVSMAEERERAREVVGERQRKRVREEIKEVSMAAGREKREREKERERESVHV